ncbi:MAG: hypothetical protein HN341_14365 [Verrucomicrobia bacterium]|jgi:hypothetical protein|nr:hypothetical protein [Verrucomicrobiota bacterium]
MTLKFTPRFAIELHETGVTDELTLQFVRDTRLMYTALYQEMVPCGEG